MIFGSTNPGYEPIGSTPVPAYASVGIRNLRWPGFNFLPFAKASCLSLAPTAESPQNASAGAAAAAFSRQRTDSRSKAAPDAISTFWVVFRDGWWSYKCSEHEQCPRSLGFGFLIFGSASVSVSVSRSVSNCLHPWTSLCSHLSGVSECVCLWARVLSFLLTRLTTGLPKCACAGALTWTMVRLFVCV